MTIWRQPNVIPAQLAAAAEAAAGRAARDAAGDAAAAKTSYLKSVNGALNGMRLAIYQPAARGEQRRKAAAFWLCRL